MNAAEPLVAIVPAKDEAERIALTLESLRSLPEIGEIVVVDDGSSDDTAKIAQQSGAVVISHKRNCGKAAALSSGGKYLLNTCISAGVMAVNDGALTNNTSADATSTKFPLAVLLIDADLGDSAAACAPLIPPILAGKADCTIANLPVQKGAGGRGFVTGLGRKYIKKLTGWDAQQPLSGQRCLSWEAFQAAQPFAPGWGVEVGMTIDLLRRGYRLQEIPCALQHRASHNDFAGQLHRGKQYLGVWRAILPRLLWHS